MLESVELESAINVVSHFSRNRRNDFLRRIEKQSESYLLNSIILQNGLAVHRPLYSKETNYLASPRFRLRAERSLCTCFSQFLTSMLINSRDPFVIALTVATKPLGNSMFLFGISFDEY